MTHACTRHTRLARLCRGLGFCTTYLPLPHAWGQIWVPQYDKATRCCLTLARVPGCIATLVHKGAAKAKQKGFEAPTPVSTKATAKPKKEKKTSAKTLSNVAQEKPNASKKKSPKVETLPRKVVNQIVAELSSSEDEDLILPKATKREKKEKKEKKPKKSEKRDKKQKKESAKEKKSLKRANLSSSGGGSDVDTHPKKRRSSSTSSESRVCMMWCVCGVCVWGGGVASVCPYRACIILTTKHTEFSTACTLHPQAYTNAIPYVG